MRWSNKSHSTTAMRPMKPVDARPEHYVPALRYRWLTPYYDKVVSWTTREIVFRQKLLDQANLGENDRVLDLACGTETMALMIKSRHPGTVVSGLDGDSEILGVAREKVKRAGLDCVPPRQCSMRVWGGRCRNPFLRCIFVYAPIGHALDRQRPG